MPVKPKNKPRIGSATDYIRAHPRITWGTISAVLSVLAIIAGGVLWVVARFETTGDAHIHALKDDQRSAWVSYGISDLKTTLLKNRLNDCKSKTRLNVMEQQICTEYEQDYNDAAQRGRDLYKAAISTTKETP